MEIKDSSALELWKKALNYVIKQGEDYLDNDGRTCREVASLVLNLENPDINAIEYPIDIMTSSKKWVYPSKEELSNIVFKENQAPIYEYTYGGRIFNFASTFDQVNAFIIPLLKEDRDSRRAVISIYDPIQDSSIYNRNTPGLIYFHFRTKGDKLLITAHIRSNDLFFGWPANLYQVFVLQKSVSKSLGLGIGTITIISNSAHVFEEDFADVSDILGELG